MTIVDEFTIYLPKPTKVRVTALRPDSDGTEWFWVGIGVEYKDYTEGLVRG